MRPELSAVPETMLWTLYQRAAARTVLDDPRAVELVERLDFPFDERFGAAGAGQLQGLRVRCFDEEVHAFQRTRPGGLVVALGEGLETQFHRVDDGRVRWLTVDLPESIHLREALLPVESDRQRVLAGSVTDPQWIRVVHEWMAEDDGPRAVLFTAQGLLMYLPPVEVHRVFRTIAADFPGSSLVFDAVTPWFAALLRRMVRSPGGWRFPPMPWVLTGVEELRIQALSRRITLHDLRPPAGHGPFFHWVVPAVNRLPLLHRLGPTGIRILRADISPPDPARSASM